jgi:16S rRNA processing protein RimM
MTERTTLEVGRITKAHGLRGQVIVDLWTDRVERLAKGATLETDRGALVVVSANRHQNAWLVTFDRIATRTDAENWRGVVLSAEKLHDEDDDVIWIDELFGAEVVDQFGHSRGRVRDVEANPASDLLVLDSGFLVPLTFIVAIEPNTRIVIEAPEGLFEP